MENKNIVVSWSIAYDVIMSYNWEFKDVIKADNLKNLSASFLVENLKKETWWTGLNIAYNLSLVWEKSILLSSVWKDFSFDGFFREKTNLKYIYQSSALFSSSFYIITDSNLGQMNTFYPWAMNES